MSEGIHDAVLINRTGDVVGLAFQVVYGIAHSNANTNLKNHRSIVASIAKGYGMGWGETFMTSHGEDALALVGPVSGDVGEFRMPAA